MKEVTLSMEVRFLPLQIVSNLGNILQLDGSWKEVMSLIPADPWVSGQFLPDGMIYPRKYTAEDISLVSDECNLSGRTGFEVITEEWGTSGKKRAKVSDLIDILMKAGLDRSVAYLRSHLKDSSENDERVDDFNIIELEQNSCMSENQSETEIDFSTNIPLIPLKTIQHVIEAGLILGEGSFGEVYKSKLSIEGKETLVAVKLLKDSEDLSKQNFSKEKVFRTEIEILSKCSHDNIISLIGYSFGRLGLALVYPFMSNGSLFDQLSSSKPEILSWNHRLEIAKGTAEGIVYLHTSFNPPLIHRDVKSPNILLDEYWIPKLGDFGIVRAGARAISTDTTVKTTPIGTQMYMAPEAFRGDVSVKMDTFSFAIVLLELLTGLPFFDENRECRDLLSFVEEYEGDEIELLDHRAGSWDIGSAKRLFQLAETCTKEKRERPDMVTTLKLLKEI